MLSRIEVRHFQSLHHVDLELDRFTVIVGASSSGKSAFTRALRTLTSNARGTSFIEHGEQTCVITAVGDAGTVSVSKGKTDNYRIVPLEGPEKTYTKLHGEVPEQATEILGIPAKDAINFAGQFDMPYLLKASPSEVARILGELTNADVVFNAAKESNRRRLAAASTLRVKSEDLADIGSRAEKYATLRTRLDALESAESLVLQAQALDERITDLDRLTSKLESATERHARALSASGVEVPSVAVAQEAEDDLTALIALLKLTSARTHQITTISAGIETLNAEVGRLEQAYIAALHETGTCPTCGQDTRGVSHV